LAKNNRLRLHEVTTSWREIISLKTESSNSVAFVEEPDKIAAKSQADRKNRQSFGRWDIVESKTNPLFTRGSRLD
jgi:hypothetical protein